jgi:uncharacterized small protein (DUF1192 family)
MAMAETMKKNRGRNAGEALARKPNAAPGFLI